MTIAIPGSWEFGGVRLASIGAVTELDGYLDIPSRRSDNVKIPLVDGDMHVDKNFDQRNISFGLEIMAGNITELELKFDLLKQLIGWRQPQILRYQSATGWRQILAECATPFGPVRDPDPLVAKIVLDFLCADPMFRSETIFTNTQTINTDPFDYTLTCPGTVEVTDAIFELTGPLHNPSVRQLTTGIWFGFTGTISPGAKVVVDCKNMTAVYTGGINVINNMSHGGDPSFMKLRTGVNYMRASDSTHTTGSVTVHFYPPYL